VLLTVICLLIILGGECKVLWNFPSVPLKSKFFRQLSVPIHLQFVFVGEGKRPGSRQYIAAGKIVACLFQCLYFRVGKRSLINFIVNVNFIPFEDNKSVIRHLRLYNTSKLADVKLFIHSYILSFVRTFIHSFIHSFTHSVVCLTTDPLPLPNRVLHIMRASASSFNFQYPSFFLRSSNGCLRLLPRLLVTFIVPFIFLQ
jgi:hypothetical protein